MTTPPDPFFLDDVLGWALCYQTHLHEWEQDIGGDEARSTAAVIKFEADLPQIRKFQRSCAQLMESNEQAAILCSKLAGVAGHLLDMCLPRLDLIRWREDGLAGARKANLVEDQIGHLTYLSYVHFGNNQSQKALELLDEATELAQLLEDRRGLATILQHRGMFYTQLDRLDEATNVLQESLTLFDQLDDISAKSKCLASIATCCSRQNNQERAVALYQQAIDIEQDLSARGTYLCNLSGDHMTLQRFTEAHEYLQQAEMIGNQISNETLLGLVYAQFGRWYASQPDAELRHKAWTHYEDALTVFQKKGDRIHEQQVTNILISLYTQVLGDHGEHLSDEHISHALRRLLSLYRGQGDFDNTIRICNQLQEASQRQCNTPDQLEATVFLGVTELQLGHYDQAITILTQAIEVLETIRQREDPKSNVKAEAEIYLGLGQAYRHTNKLEFAIECYKKAEQIALNLDDKEMEFRAIGNLGLIYTDQNQHDEAKKLLSYVMKSYEEMNEHRLFGHAQFNLAYAHFREGDRDKALEIGSEALRHLTIINDSKIHDIKQQINDWIEASLCQTT